jgi:hypothetical protein
MGSAARSAARVAILPRHAAPVGTGLRMNDAKNPGPRAWRQIDTPHVSGG